MNKWLIRQAGKHHVLHKLAMEGLYATAQSTSNNLIDVRTESRGPIVATVYVRVRSFGADGGWHMNEKHETQDDVHYAFVDLEGDPPPRTYIIPAATVRDVLHKSHQTWLATPGQNGQAHNDNVQRRILPDYSVTGLDVPSYPAGWMDDGKERWGLLTEVAQ